MKEYEQRATKIIMNTVEGVKAQIRKAYDKGYKDGQKEILANAMIYDHEEAEKKAYDRGLADMLEVFKSMRMWTADDLEEVFGLRFIGDIIVNLSPSKIVSKYHAFMARIKELEDAEIKVGDEVIGEFGNKGIVITNVPSPLGDVSVWFSNQTHVQLYPVKNLSKTGRHFDQIAEVLAELRGAENDE